MVLVLSFGIVLSIEVFNSLASSIMDEYFKLKKHQLINLGKSKFFVYKFICGFTAPKKYYEWLKSQKKYNEQHISKPALIFQCFIHIYSLYNIILGFTLIDPITFNNIPSIYWILGIVPSAILGFILAFIIPTVIYILLDKEIAKRFPKDSN